MKGSDSANNNSLRTSNERNRAEHGTDVEKLEMQGDVPLDDAEKWRILKNVTILSFAFMVHFTAFTGASNLQSSINADASLGTNSMAAIYAALIFSNLFLPVVMINWLGCKWTVALSYVAYMPFIAAQFYPRVYTLIPAALCVGLGGGPLWCAKCTYLSVVSEVYEKITGLASDVIVVRFFGIFFMIFQFCQVWGNLISSLVLSAGEPTGTTTTVNNTREMCGGNFLPSASTEALPPQPVEKVYTIASIYLVCMVLASLIVAVGVDPLTRYDKYRKGSGTGLNGLQMLAITIKLLMERNQMLLLVITGWLGLSQAFMGADFTSAYVACAWGTGNIGYVMICYGVVNSISAIGTGSLVKITGRIPVVVSASLLQVALIITLLTWKPHADEFIVFFVVSGLWGVCDGVWLVQINALCGILFPSREEAAYSNFRLWESLGFIIAYLYSPSLRASVKLYILLAVLIIGMVGYILVEIFEIKKTKLNGKENLTRSVVNAIVDNDKEGGVSNNGYDKED